MRSFAIVLSLMAGCAHAPTPSATEPASAPQEVAPQEAAPRVVERAAFSVSITGQGPAVVLIPGLTCGGHVWDDTVAHQKERHTVHVLTLSGFAGRPALDGPFLPTVRDELAAYLGTLERPVVVGHSLGGFMALWLAATEGDALGGAVAVDGLPALGALGGQGPEQIAATATMMRTQMAALSQDAFAEQTAQTILAQVSDPAEANRVAQVSGRSDPAAVGQAMQEMLTTDLRPMLSQAQAPVLLLGAGAGTAQQVATRETLYREQVSAIPEHEVVMVPQTRHFVMLDAPEAFLQQLDRFLAAHP